MKHQYFSVFILKQVVEYGSGIKSLKLGDFGLAVETTEPLFIVCGTPTYVAPEILQESGYDITN